MIDILEETKLLMKQYEITANKNLGQNFLINEDIIEKIIMSANITKQDLIIEIGPGLGTLTKRLLENAGRVIAIELDDRMLTILQKRFFMDNHFVLINDDVLKVDLQELIKQYKGTLENLKIEANIQYYITTPIIMKLLEQRLEIESITVMVQKEVADRITAIPGNKLAGAITYSVYYYAKPDNICFVSKQYFLPSPELDSAVIKLEIRRQPIVELKSEEMFFRVIKASFMQRRKTLLNGLTNASLVKNKEEGKELLAKLNIAENTRGESLTIEQFAQIANELT